MPTWFDAVLGQARYFALAASFSYPQGEITSGAFLFNSNERLCLVHLSATPREWLSAGIIYWRFARDEPPSFAGPRGSARHSTFADEVNAYVNWTALPEVLYVSPVASVAFPAAGAEDAGGDEAAVPFELYVTLAL